MDYISVFLDLWQHHRGKILGILIGLLVGISFAILGFWKTLILWACIFAGYYIGKKLDAQESIKAVFSKLWDKQ